MKFLVITTACLAGFTSSSFAAEVEAVELPAPKEWKKEIITLPPGFAPDMKLRGSEHIRFAPGMFQPNSDSFFSYLFLFKLEKEPELKPETIRQEFLKYFRGLAVAVLKDRAAEVNTAKFTLKINPSAFSKRATHSYCSIFDPESKMMSYHRGVLAFPTPAARRRN